MITLYLKAVCALILRPNNKVLAVSRKTDLNNFGLPGGKVELMESELEALIREVKEETGLKLTEVYYLYHSIDSQDYGVTTTYVKQKAKFQLIK